MPPNLPLNEDLTTEILTWLPAKQIARLRCISKQWLSLTSDTCFIRNHSTRNPYPSPSGFFLRHHVYHTEYFPLNGHLPGLPDPSFSFIPTSADGGRISIESSCNGLIICCRAIRPSFYKSLYYVCNPTTKEFVELPVPNGIDRYFSLAFDPSKSPHYKVVSIGFRIHIYSSESRSWKLSMDKESLREFGGLCLYRSVYWNGALIWVGKECLLSFDVEGEYMKKLAMPPEPHQCSRVVYIGVSGGKLQMIGRSKNEKFTTVLFDILEMDSQCSGWSVLYHVDLDHIKDLYPEIQIQRVCVSRFGRNHPRFIRDFRGFSPVYLIRGGEEEGAEEGILLLSVAGKIISYHLGDGTFKKVCDVLTPPPGSYYCLYNWYKFYPLGHTLFSP